MRSAPLALIAPAVTLVLLAGLATQDWLCRVPAGDVEAYHRHVRAAAAALPRTIGDWVGVDVPAPAAAVRLLRPNALLYRRFTQRGTGQSAEFLFVQTRDARDMSGHYPPVCYPAHGWLPAGASPRDWQVGPQAFPGMEYRFTRTGLGHPGQLVVADFLLLPDGRCVRDMTDIRRAMKDRQARAFGAAQIQVVLPADLPTDQRDPIVRTLVGGHQALLDALRLGASHEH